MRRKATTPRRPAGRLFPPPLLPSCLGAAVFSAASLAIVAAPEDSPLPPGPVQYAVHTGAAVFLCLAVWALVRSLRRKRLRQAVSHAAHSHPLLARLYDDDSTRILWAGYGSLAVNGVLAASKLAAGWWLDSPWLMALAGYYLALCVTRALVLRSARAAAGQSSPEASLRAGWRSYRLCGVLLVTVSLSMLGVAALIVREGNGFRYEGYWIFAVALYDFYCLISALVFLIRSHRRRSPALLAVKQISFAASLVSMLSLQTAMLAAFDTSSPAARSRMNLITGAAVCLLLAVLGLGMVLLARARLKKLPEKPRSGAGNSGPASGFCKKKKKQED